MPEMAGLLATVLCGSLLLHRDSGSDVVRQGIVKAVGGAVGPAFGLGALDAVPTTELEPGRRARVRPGAIEYDPRCRNLLGILEDVMMDGLEALRAPVEQIDPYWTGVTDELAVRLRGLERPSPDAGELSRS
jgi:hypothetical protein